MASASAASVWSGRKTNAHRATANRKYTKDEMLGYFQPFHKPDGFPHYQGIVKDHPQVPAWLWRNDGERERPLHRPFQGDRPPASNDTHSTTDSLSAAVDNAPTTPPVAAADSDWEQTVWCYKQDKDSVERTGYTFHEISDWLRDGFFGDSLLVRRRDEEEFRSVEDVIKIGSRPPIVCETATEQPTTPSASRERNDRPSTPKSPFPAAGRGAAALAEDTGGGGLGRGIGSPAKQTVASVSWGAHIPTADTSNEVTSPWGNTTPWYPPTPTPGPYQQPQQHQPIQPTTPTQPPPQPTITPPLLALSQPQGNGFLGNTTTPPLQAAVSVYPPPPLDQPLTQSIFGGPPTPPTPTLTEALTGSAMLRVQGGSGGISVAELQQSATLAHQQQQQHQQAQHQQQQAPLTPESGPLLRVQGGNSGISVAQLASLVEGPKPQPAADDAGTRGMYDNEQSVWGQHQRGFYTTPPTTPPMVPLAAPPTPPHSNLTGTYLPSSTIISSLQMPATQDSVWGKPRQPLPYQPIQHQKIQRTGASNLEQTTFPHSPETAADHFFQAPLTEDPWAQQQRDEEGGNMGKKRKKKKGTKGSEAGGEGDSDPASISKQANTPTAAQIVGSNNKHLTPNSSPVDAFAPGAQSKIYQEPKKTSKQAAASQPSVWGAQTVWGKKTNKALTLAEIQAEQAQQATQHYQEPDVDQRHKAREQQVESTTDKGVWGSVAQQNTKMKEIQNEQAKEDKKSRKKKKPQENKTAPTNTEPERHTAPSPTAQQGKGAWGGSSSPSHQNNSNTPSPAKLGSPQHTNDQDGEDFWNGTNTPTTGPPAQTPAVDAEEYPSLQAAGGTARIGGGRNSPAGGYIAAAGKIMGGGGKGGTAQLDSSDFPSLGAAVNNNQNKKTDKKKNKDTQPPQQQQKKQQKPVPQQDSWARDKIKPLARKKGTDENNLLNSLSASTCSEDVHQTCYEALGNGVPVIQFAEEYCKKYFPGEARTPQPQAMSGPGKKKKKGQQMNNLLNFSIALPNDLESVK